MSFWLTLISSIRSGTFPARGRSLSISSEHNHKSHAVILRHGPDDGETQPPNNKQTYRALPRPIPTSHNTSSCGIVPSSYPSFRFTRFRRREGSISPASILLRSASFAFSFHSSRQIATFSPSQGLTPRKSNAGPLIDAKRQFKRAPSNWRGLLFLLQSASILVTTGVNLGITDRRQGAAPERLESRLCVTN